jgi:hypothetical protein
VLSPSLNASGFLGSSPLFPFASMAELIRPTSEVPKVVLMSSTPSLNDLVLFWSDLPRFAQPLLLLWFWVALMISSLWHPLRRQTLLPSSSHHLVRAAFKFSASSLQTLLRHWFNSKPPTGSGDGGH